MFAEIVCLILIRVWRGRMIMCQISSPKRFSTERVWHRLNFPEQVWHQTPAWCTLFSDWNTSSNHIVSTSVCVCVAKADKTYLDMSFGFPNTLRNKMPLRRISARLCSLILLSSLLSHLYWLLLSLQWHCLVIFIHLCLPAAPI